MRTCIGTQAHTLALNVRKTCVCMQCNCLGPPKVGTSGGSGLVTKIRMSALLVYPPPTYLELLTFMHRCASRRPRALARWWRCCLWHMVLPLPQGLMMRRSRLWSRTLRSSCRCVRLCVCVCVHGFFPCVLVLYVCVRARARVCVCMCV